MVESQKGASSTADSKKEGPTFEGEIGKDFLSSWKSTTVGKDALDFSTQTVPRERKKAFDFDKLDDFEFGGDFGKLSSFNVGISDLDFSSPHKKAEKPKQRPGKEAILGKQEGKKDNFSFNFDFNELDAFDLDSNLLTGEKRHSKCADNTVLDIFENSDKKLPQVEIMTSSKSKDLIGSQGELGNVNSGAPHSVSNLEHCKLSHEALASPEKPVTTALGSKNEINESEEHREQLEMAGFRKPNVEQLTQDLSIQSGNDSAIETFPQFQTAFPSKIEVNANSGGEEDNSVRSKCSFQSRSTSPVKAYDSKCSAAVCITESLGTDNELQKNQGDRNDNTRGSVIVNESAKTKKNVGDTFIGVLSHEMVNGTSGIGEKHNPDSKIIQSSLHMDSRSEKFIPIKEKGNNGLQLKTLNKLEATEFQLSSASTPKQLYAICNKKMETINLCHANAKRASGGNAEQAGDHKGGVLKSFNKTLIKNGSVILGSGRNHKDSNAPDFQVQPWKLPEKTTSCGTPKIITPKLVPSIAPINNSKIVSVEKHGLSPKKADKKCDLSSLKMSRITNLNNNSSNPLSKETKLVGHSEGNLEVCLKTSTVAHSFITGKHTLLSLPLKRKSLEGSHVDLLTLNPSKHLLGSPGERRKSSAASPKVDSQVIPGTENMEDLYNNVCFAHQNSSVGVPVEGNMMDLDVTLLVENDGTVEKAEACAKDLQNICSTLKKKHEEAKELLVRAIVNNNSLLMLNHPMYEEKIHALQRFAASLLSKQYET